MREVTFFVSQIGVCFLQMEWYGVVNTAVNALFCHFLDNQIPVTFNLDNKEMVDVSGVIGFSRKGD